MVGDWIDQDEGATNETSVKWSKNRAFLIRSFRLSLGGADPLSGMQVIAWDPAEKHIRSWTYDSRGGFGEESWTPARETAGQCAPGLPCPTGAALGRPRHDACKR